MQIVGKWLVGDDGTARPTVRVTVRRPNGTFSTDDFLVDPCADCTVLSASLLGRLPGATQPAPAGSTLQGITRGNAGQGLAIGPIASLCL
jgi:hypothetical protein